MTVSYEPAKIPGDGENTDSFSHWDIYNKFHPLDTGKARSSLEDYDKLAKEWSTAAAFFASRIKQSSAAAWQGKAADASRTAIANYAQRTEELTDALNALTTQVHSAIDGVTGTQHGVAEPMQRVSDWNFWDGDFMWHHGVRSKQKIDEARDEAREAMKQHYVTNFVAADKQIPVIPKPNAIGDPLYTYTPNSGVNPPNSGVAPSSGPAGPANSHSGSGGQSGDQQSSGHSDSTSTAGYGSSSMPSMPGPSSSMGTTPSGYFSGTSPTSTIPSNFGGTGSGSGGDSALNGLGAAAGGGLGRSVPGGPVTGSNAARAANAANAGGKTTGMPGMGGMGAAGKGKGENDKEHALPEWLRTMENAEELLGPVPKSVPDGVIGGNFDQNPRPPE